MKKIKVLILIPRMGGGGAERVVSVIANSLCDKYDIQITTLVSNSSFYKLNSKIKFTSANYTINRQNKLTRLCSIGINFFNSIRYIRNITNNFKPDIVFSLLKEMDIVTYLALFNCPNIKRITSERNDPNQRNKYLQKLLEYIYQNSDTLVCQSMAVADYYKGVSNEKKIVIPNPVDFKNYPERSPEKLPLKIVSVGRLVKQKNFGLLINAFVKLSVKYPDVTVVIYGEGPEREKLEEQIKEKKLEHRIFLPGATQDVLQKIRDAAIFAFPTNYEGFPNVLLEAVAMGIPVITTDFATGIAREVVKAEVGRIIPCNDIEAFSNALDELLSNKQCRHFIRENGYKEIQKFNVDYVIEQWNDLFIKLVNTSK